MVSTMFSDAIERKTSEALAERAVYHPEHNAVLPVWVRAPIRGPEHYSGLTRAKLYDLDAKGKIKSRSVKEPGAQRGCRLFNLRSILDFIETNGD